MPQRKSPTTAEPRANAVTPIAARRSRYRPMLSSRGTELISAAMRRQLDAEALCERLSSGFVGTLRLMDDDELLVLELVANGISSHHDFLPDLFGEGRDPDRVIDAARRFAAKRERTRKGGAR